MSDETGSPAGSEAVTVVTLPADAPESFSSEREAARYLSESRRKNDAPPAESAPVATAEEPELAQANAAPPEEAPSEEPEAAEPQAEALEPIEPPRSWTKAEKERFQSLPRETQEYLHTREQEREREVRRSQNEAADIRKAAEAERKQLEEARKEYEAKLPALMESLQRQSEFADIRTLDDVKKLQTEDPFRFQAWQVFQMDAQAVEQERRAAEQRQAAQKQTERDAYERDQNAKLHELIPETQDPEKLQTLRSEAVTMLVDDYGFSESELGAAMQTDDGFRILNDARWQKLIADGLKLAKIQKASKAVAAKPLPPVQRPGTVQPKASQAQKIQALEKQINNASGNAAIRLAAELNRLRRSA